MPPVEIVPYIWTRDRVLICGRVTALRQGDGAYFGVQLPAPTALCTDRAAVRALLVHEFAHWFYIATRVSQRLRVRGKGSRHFGPPERGAHRIRHADQRARLVRGRGRAEFHPTRRLGDALDFEPGSGLERQFYVVSPRMGDTVGGIDISDDVKAHIRSLRAQRITRSRAPSV